jgi:hypothetical protein
LSIKQHRLFKILLSCVEESQKKERNGGIKSSHGTNADENNASVWFPAQQKRLNDHNFKKAKI